MVKPTPIFPPGAVELVLASVWLLVTTPDVQVNPHQIHAGVHLTDSPTVMRCESAAIR